MGDTMSEQQQNQGESQDKKVEQAEENKSPQPKESKLQKAAEKDDKDDKADKPTDDDIEAKIREAVARERKKAIEETKAALKAEAEEKERLAKMAAEDRLKAEKEKAEKESAAAKAEATAASRKLELYRMLTTSGAQPAADTALPMIEQAFSAALEAGASDAAAAMKEVRKSMPFLFKQAADDKAPDKKPMPDPQASTTTIQSQSSSTAVKKPAAPDPKTAKLDDYYKYFEQTKAAS